MLIQMLPGLRMPRGEAKSFCPLQVHTFTLSLRTVKWRSVNSSPLLCSADRTLGGQVIRQGGFLREEVAGGGAKRKF